MSCTFLTPSRTAQRVGVTEVELHLPPLPLPCLFPCIKAEVIQEPHPPPAPFVLYQKRSQADTLSRHARLVGA